MFWHVDSTTIITPDLGFAIFQFVKVGDWTDHVMDGTYSQLVWLVVIYTTDFLPWNYLSLPSWRWCSGTFILLHWWRRLWFCHHHKPSVHYLIVISFIHSTAHDCTSCGCLFDRCCWPAWSSLTYPQFDIHTVSFVTLSLHCSLQTSFQFYPCSHLQAVMFLVIKPLPLSEGTAGLPIS